MSKLYSPETKLNYYLNLQKTGQSKLDTIERELASEQRRHDETVTSLNTRRERILKQLNEAPSEIERLKKEIAESPRMMELKKQADKLQAELAKMSPEERAEFERLMAQ